MEVTQIIAAVYLASFIVFKLAEVFIFGQERPPYSPTLWLLGLFINLPVFYLLWLVATGY